MTTYTRWYREGTASLDMYSVIGTNTYWKSAGINVGDLITFDNGKSFYEISSVFNDVKLSLKTKYEGEIKDDQSYAIVRNFTSAMPSTIAAQTAELLLDFKKYINTDMQRLTGKSAYEIAKDNGFTGTETEWLESLKAAGELGALASRVTALENSGDLTALTERVAALEAVPLPDILTTHNAGSHNALYRGKKIGSALTEEQIATIAAGKFEGLYPGDYWQTESVTYTYYEATSDKKAKDGKTYYADAKGNGTGNSAGSWG